LSVFKRERLRSIAAFGALVGGVFFIGRKTARKSESRGTAPSRVSAARADSVAAHEQPPSSDTPPAWLNPTRKGTIWPRKTWQIAGATGPHVLVLDCGRFGHGPMHATVDGLPALTFAKPSRRQPWVVSPTGTIDGREVVIYADTRDRGDLVGCDVFVDGFSVHNGAPIETLGDRQAKTNTAIAEFVSPFEAGNMARGFISTLTWMAIPFSFSGFAYRFSDHSQAQVLTWFGIYSAAVLVLLMAAKLAVRRLPTEGWHRRLAASALVLGCFAGILAFMAFIVAFGPLAAVPNG